MNIVSFSGGKDSTAMLLRLLETGVTIDRIVFADTGFEFPELYQYIERIEKYLGRKVERVYPSSNFSDWVTGQITRGDRKGQIRGFPLEHYPCYWTREAKVKPLQALEDPGDVVYVGIAYDERKRCTSNENIRYPLVDWKWTEQDCVDYLNQRGMLNPLYKNFKRLGCYFCPKQGKKSLYVLWKLYPHLWDEMKEWESRNLTLTGYTIKDLPLSDYEKEFSSGEFKPSTPAYECWEGCEAVKSAFLQSQRGLSFYGDYQKEGGL